MRVQIIVTANPCTPCVNRQLATMLIEGLGQTEGVILTDKGPDIVHVFGRWDVHTSGVVTSVCARKIPLVYTSLCGLVDSADALQGGARVQRTLARDKILSHVSVAHVSGALEEKAIKRGHSRVQTCVIANPFVTNVLSPDDALQDMVQLYRDTMEKHDAHIRAAIDTRAKHATTDEVIATLCSQFLYVKYMLHRGGIAQSLMDGLAAQMTECQYDEDAFAQAVKRLGISGFARSLLSALSKASTLTEGFMPFDPMEDKLTSRIIRNIIND